MKQIFAFILISLALYPSCGKQSSPVRSSAPIVSTNQLVSLSSKLPSSEVESTLFQSQKSTFESNDPGWILTFNDEFDGKELSIAKGANPECFSKTPTCMINWWARNDCPEYASQLTDLNKCHWDVYHYYNYMDWDAPEGTGINAFHPKQVKVENGLLILSAEKSNFTRPSCKVKFQDPRTGTENLYF